MIPLRDSIRSRRFPVVTVAIIVANIAVYIYQSGLSDRALNIFFMQYGVVPADVSSIGRLLLAGRFMLALQVLGTLVTSMFVHGGLLHLGGNMLYLWVFGDNVEDRLGASRYFFFYILTGMIATLTHIATGPASEIPLIGASGAIAGVLGAYFVSFPGSRVMTLVPLFLFITTVEIPAVVFLAIWFILQLFSGFGSLSGAAESTAWWAHIGGFAAGALLIWLMAGRTSRTDVESDEGPYAS